MRSNGGPRLLIVYCANFKCSLSVIISSELAYYSRANDGVHRNIGRTLVQALTAEEIVPVDDAYLTCMTSQRTSPVKLDFRAAS